jgi:hypothetical protein
MNTDFTSHDELDALRARVVALEEQSTHQAAKANAAVAAAQDRSYWLDRWNVDLNAVMRRRGASEARAALRALRSVYRLLPDGSRALRKLAGRVPAKLDSTKRVVAEDRARAVRAALESAGLEPRDGDVWVRIGADGLDELDALRERLAPGGRAVLEADGVTPGRLLSRSTPDWRVAIYLEGDPDVYVLERR